MKRDFVTFSEFYRYYLTQHSTINCRRMHFVGTLLVIMDLAFALIQHNFWWLIWAPFLGYGCAWLGHGLFEKNRPATFGHPIWSLIGDGRMFWDTLRSYLRLR
ncbi:MAG: Mpo1-like protein [Gammaproteobacteria bacterium]